MSDLALSIRWLGRIAFADALALQEKLVAEKRADRSLGDELLLLEHEPVYTIGRTPDQSSLRDVTHLPHPPFPLLHDELAAVGAVAALVRRGSAVTETTALAPAQEAHTGVPGKEAAGRTPPPASNRAEQSARAAGCAGPQDPRARAREPAPARM